MQLNPSTESLISVNLLFSGLFLSGAVSSLLGSEANLLRLLLFEVVILPGLVSSTVLL